MVAGAVKPGGSRHRSTGSEYRNTWLYFIGLGGSATPEYSHVDYEDKYVR